MWLEAKTRDYADAAVVFSHDGSLIQGSKNSFRPSADEVRRFNPVYYPPRFSQHEFRFLAPETRASIRCFLVIHRKLFPALPKDVLWIILDYLVAEMARFGEWSHLYRDGLLLEGKKFLVLHCDEKVITGRSGDGIGVHICKTEKVYVVAKYGRTIQPAQCAVGLGKLTDYLCNVGY
jgi:hypothetical protein